MASRIVRFVIVFAVIGFIWRGFIFRDRLSGQASDLAVGDCFKVPADQLVSDVQHTPCAEAHDGEVILVARYPAADDAAYPAESAIQAWVTSTCLPAFKTYTGTDYESATNIELGYYAPTSAGWAGQQHDRGMTCFISPPTEQAVSTSYRAAAATK
jgi:hypothetical protein